MVGGGEGGGNGERTSSSSSSSSPEAHKGHRTLEGFPSWNYSVVISEN